MEINVKVIAGGVPNAGSLTINLPNGYTIDTNKLLPGGRIGIAYSEDAGVSGYDGFVYVNNTNSIGLSHQDTSGQHSKSSAVSSTGPFHFNINDFSTATARVPIVGWGAAGSIYSQPYQNTDRIGEVIFTTNANAPSGFISALGSSIGSSTSAALFKGESFYPLYEQLWNTAGLSTTAGDPYRISSAKGASALSDWTANKTITIDYATNELFIRSKGTGRLAGSYQSDAFQGHWHNVYGLSQQGVNVGQADDINQGTNLLGNKAREAVTDGTNGTPRVANETRPKNVALYAYVRYQADSQVAVLNISGLESCTNSYECTDTFSAKVSAAGVVSDENIDWINGNTFLTDTSLYTYTFKTGIFTSAPNCVVSPSIGDVSTGDAVIVSASSTQVVVRTGFSVNTSAMSKNAYLHQIICQKQGADYIGKTSKAVASDQHPLKSELNYVQVNATGTTQSLPNAVSTTMIYTAEQMDNTGSFNPATGIFTAPKNGVYCTSFRVSVLTGGGVTELLPAIVAASTAHEGTRSISTASLAVIGGTASSCLFLNLGEQIFTTTYQSSGVAKNTERFFLSITRIPGQL
jgi:hypothetical protein